MLDWLSTELDKMRHEREGQIRRQGFSNFTAATNCLYDRDHSEIEMRSEYKHAANQFYRKFVRAHLSMLMSDELCSCGV